MKSYRRRLPHLDLPGKAVFVPWSLRGSLPAERGFTVELLTSGEAFAAYDRILGETRTGPMYLRQPELAQLVVAALREAEADLHAYVVMPHHVHVLWTPHRSNVELIRRVKGATAMRANRLLGQAGQPFWNQEYFDRIARNEEEFARIRRYIESNPVKAGLVARTDEYRWSSAFGRG